MVHPTIDVVVVSYRPGPALVRCLDSVLASTNVSARIILVNCDPQDRLPAKLGAANRDVRLIEPGINLGFCAGANAGLESGNAPFALLLNPDAWLSPDYIATLIDLLSSDPSAASASGLIGRATPDGRPTRFVDSAGIEMLRGRRPVDIGHGRPLPARGRVREVFGVSAAAAMYRRSALEEVAVDGQVLPSEFFMYVDDVDLAWRLRLLGYRSLVDPAAVAHHSRHIGGAAIDAGEGLAYWVSAVKREGQRPSYVRILSWANLLLTIVRNDHPTAFLRQLPYFSTRRMPLELFSLTTAPNIAVAARRRFLGLLPKALDQRRQIQVRRRVPPADMRRWIP